MSDLTRLNRLFDEVVALPPEEREAFLKNACGDDVGLLKQLKSLLIRDAQAETPLDASLDDLVGTLVSDDLERQRVGPYRLIRKIGHGGMGTVYLAEREDGAFEQRVAVKVVKRGMDSEEVVRRFRSERQILAKLEHPHVGRLYDGGIAPDGRPYLAMEYVEGSPITEFADARRLSLTDRIELFDDAAAAVRFAHLNLVVHRDLKPSNVLVADDGTVKLLDFGIAKLLDADPESGLTQVGHRVLTPGYAAPEQLDGGAITTATDVFSLGVVLHELLTGLRPAFRGSDPLPPSTTVRIRPGSLGANQDHAVVEEAPDLSRLSRLRGTTPERLSQQLRGDLDAILLKALEHDPQRRYPSVDSLIDDLQRFREGRPVTARTPTATYRLARLVRRNRLAFGAGVGVVSALAVGMGIALQQRSVAVQERNAAEAVTGYLEGMFESVNPVGRNPGADTLRVIDFLDRSTESALTELEDDPLVRGRLLRTLGRAHFSLGDTDRALDLWGRSATAYREAGRPVDVEVQFGLAEGAIDSGDWATADSIMPILVSSSQRDSDPLRVARAQALHARMSVVRERLDEADSLLALATPTLRSLGEDGRLADALVLHAAVAWNRREVGEAMQYTEEAVALWEASRGPDDFQVAVGLTNLSILQRATGALDEAEESLVRAIAILETRAAPGHSTRVSAMNAYASLLDQRGDTRRADSMFTAAALESTRPGSTATLIQIYANHAGNRQRAADTVGALRLARAAVETAEGVFGATPPLLDPLVRLGMTLDFAGDSTGAERTYGRAVDVAGEAIAPANTGRIIAERGVARGLSRRGRHAEARQLLLALLERTPAGAPPQSERYRTRRSTLRELVAASVRAGNEEDAEHFRSMRENPDDTLR